MFLFDVFTAEQIQAIKSDISQKNESKQFFYSKIWYNQVLEKDRQYIDEHGDIQVMPVDESIKAILRKILNRINPKCRHYDFNAMYQIWDKNSGCGLHKDSHCPFVATFYLNEKWSPNDGGLYVYEEDNDYKVYVPKFNSCNFNMRGEYGNHCVTPITPYARDKRYTIQVFAKE